MNRKIVGRTLLALGLAGLVGGAGCSKKGGASGDAMKLLPKETGVLVSVNVDKLRAAKPWEKVKSVRDSDPETKKKYDEFVAGAGFDPFNDVKSLLIAVPANAAAGSKDFAMILESNKALDEKKIIAYATAEAKKSGAGDVKTETYNGKTLYGSAKSDDSWATFLSDKTVAVAGKDAIKKVVDLSAGKGENVTSNAELMAVVKRADAGSAIWAGGLVPADQQKQMAPGASIMAGVASLDLTTGLKAKIEADTASPDEAKKLAEMANSQIAEAKKNPMLQMMGMGGVVDGTKVAADGKTIKVDSVMNQQQFDDLVTKVEGMAKMMGGRMGGGPRPGGMPPGGMPPGGMPPGHGADDGHGHGAAPKAPADTNLKLKLNEKK